MLCVNLTKDIFAYGLMYERLECILRMSIVDAVVVFVILLGYLIIINMVR